MKIMEQREQLGSRLGFILLSAGCAIGIGNVWKFPYMVGQYGGGAFVLIYLFFLVILGIPVMTMEFAMGRAGQRSPRPAVPAVGAEGQQVAPARLCGHGRQLYSDDVLHQRGRVDAGLLCPHRRRPVRRRRHRRCGGTIQPNAGRPATHDSVYGHYRRVGLLGVLL